MVEANLYLMLILAIAWLYLRLNALARQQRDVSMRLELFENIQDRQLAKLHDTQP